MATFSPFFISILHLACFLFASSNPIKRRSKKRKLSVSITWSFIKKVFSSKPIVHNTRPESTILSPSSSTRSFRQSDLTSLIRRRKTGSFTESDNSGQTFYTIRPDIHPCPFCGEVFNKPGLLEQHQSIRHAVSELTDLDSGKNVVRIIFNTGWINKTPNIIRVLKVRNSSKILNRFDEYREREVMRFHCATFLCDLGQNGNSALCSHQYCSVCGIIRNGFSPKVDGISTLSTSWKAHVALPDWIEEEFGFMQLKRAILVCRVIAGWVGPEPDNIVRKGDCRFDSLVGRANGVGSQFDSDDELLVFNPRAVLPCFVIVYTV